MFKKANNKVLAIVFVVLLAFVVLTNLLDARRGDRTFRNEIFDIDTADISSITIDPKGFDREDVRIFKTSDGWNVSSGEKEYPADKNIVRNILGELAGMTAQRVAATKEDNWKKYEVTDSLATKVLVETGKDDALLYIGRFSYRQPRNPQQMQMPYGQQQGTMSTYVRLGNEDEVYSVEGFIGMTFNREVDDFRNRTVIKSSRFDWEELSFSYPADSSFTLSRTDQGWFADGIKADSTLVADYLQTASNLSSSHFVDDVQSQGSPLFELQVKGAELKQPITVQAHLADSVYQYYVSSSQNPGVYFNGAQAELADKIFIGKSELLNITMDE